MNAMSTSESGNWQFEDSVTVAVEPEVLYEMISDPARTGEWSPVCRGGEWLDGGTGKVGDRFTGRNVVGKRRWTTVSEVVVADPPREFAWVVAPDKGGTARWGYVIEPLEMGSRLTESWRVDENGLAWLREHLGPQTAEQRRDAAREGIPATLAAVKGVAEREAASGC